MSAQPAVTVERLSKRYFVGHQAPRAGELFSFREMLERRVRAMARKPRRLASGRPLLDGAAVEEFWALRDVSLAVERGEVVGIIGLNGAGKSTLLKIVSRITEPTSGRVSIRGRVASLLEVGTGFHPELTGRENVFLNGAILGMSRAEIRARFDEIVAFAEVERFLDTPVKRYSSGMYVRLAFAVAAHLEPEILIVDEVLAVGDVAFQKRCLGRMKEVATHGRTVLFVSHNLAAVLDLTDRSVLMERGRIAAAGPSREIVSQFLQGLQQAQETNDLSSYRRSFRESGWVDIEQVSVGGSRVGATVLDVGESLSLEIALSVHRPVEDGIIIVNVLNESLEAVATFVSSDDAYAFSVGPGVHRVRCDLGPVPLAPGAYRLTIRAAQKGGSPAWDVVEGLPAFRVTADHSENWLRWPDRPGVLFMETSKWY